MRLVDLGDHKEDLKEALELSDNLWNVPLYESKMIAQFDHRFSTFDQNVPLEERRKGHPRQLNSDEKANPLLTVLPRYFVRNALVKALNEKYSQFDRQWLLVWRDISNVGSERTSIASIIPRHTASRTCPALGIKKGQPGWLLVAILNSFIFDYLARQKVSGLHFNWTLLSQLPVLPASSISKEWADFISIRVLELTYTAYDLQGFAEDCGYTGEPFRWDEARRFLLRAELDAAYFHLYGIGREDVDYILDTFPIVRRKDEAQHGEYRTKRVILEIYDAMQQAITSGQPYQTRLDPPPAFGWVPPELTQEAANTKSVVQPAGITDKNQSDLFAWQAEDPQQQLKFDDTE
jgi:hypothetical protein